jgi:hypothetical protein
MSHDLRLVRAELERRGAKTFGSLERCTERLQRFLDAEARAVKTPPQSPESHFPLNDPPSIVRLELDEEDLNAARILCECANTPVEERVDRLELSMLELFGNENIYHRMEDIEARIRRLERIADATEHRVYALEKKGSIYVNVPVFNENDETVSRNYTLGASSE